MNELDPQYLSLGAALNQQVPNPFFGTIDVGTLAQRTVARRQLLLPFPQFTGVNVINMTMANSIYHSLQLKVDKRFSKGMSVLLAYTAGKLITRYEQHCVQQRWCGEQSDKSAELVRSALRAIVV